MFNQIILTAILLTGFSAHATQMCAQVIVKMYNPETKAYRQATDSCHAADLKAKGWIKASHVEPLPDMPEEQEEPEVFENVSVIKSGNLQIAHPVPKCPPKAMCTPVSVLQVQLTLAGCLDKAHMTYTISETDLGKRIVTISALNLHNPKSKATKCVKLPTETKSITLGMGFLGEDDVEVHFLKSIAH